MNVYELNSARSCLRIIIKYYEIKTIFVPYYICPDVWKACRKENCEVKFYHIDDNFYPACEFNKQDYILYPNYFGICANNVIKLSNKYPNLIADNSHAFYMPNTALASFTSYRKFIDVADGARLYINKNIDIPKSKYNYDDLPENYDEFVANELRISKEEPMFISECTSNKLKSIDIEYEKTKRIENFYKYDDKFKKTNLLNIKLTEYDIPFVYPYLSYSDIDIPCFRYWNPLPESYLEYKFYKYLKPLPLKTYKYINI